MRFRLSGWQLPVLISLWFEVSWFVAVVGQSSWLPLLVVMAAVAVASSIWLLDGHLLSILSVFGLGVLLDSINQALGVLVFPSAWLPYWLVGLWVMFAWYAWHILPYLAKYPKIWLVLGTGLGGAASYFAGERLDAVEFGLPLFATLFVLLVEWCLVMLIILRIYHGQVKGQRESASRR